MKKSSKVLLVIFFITFGFFAEIACKHLAERLTKSNEASRVWLSTCTIFYCNEAIKMCNQNGCLGEANCVKCIGEYHTSCELCAKEIFELNLAQVNTHSGVTDFFCDSNITLHNDVCSLYCRANFLRKGGSCSWEWLPPQCICQS
jgi:hypothetical protein